MYYKIRQPGDSFTPEQWMLRTIIKELWEFSITIWKQKNSELVHSTDGAISVVEKRRKDTASNGVCGTIAIWKQRNAELHGTDGAVSMEQRRKEAVTEEAVAVYQATIGNVSPSDSVVLHHACIDEILKSTRGIWMPISPLSM
jgi:hypothetical protein